MTCEDELTYNVNLTNFSLVHIDNAGEAPIETTIEETVSKDAYVLKIQLAFEEEFAGSVCEKGHELRPSPSITNIQINAIHQPTDEESPTALQDVTNDFRCYQIIDMPHKYDVVPLPMSDIDKLVNTDIYMALYNIPQTGGTYQFEVNITLQDTRVITKTTNQVTLY